MSIPKQSARIVQYVGFFLMQGFLLIGYTRSNPIVIVGFALLILGTVWVTFSESDSPIPPQLFSTKIFWPAWLLFFLCWLAVVFAQYYSFNFNNFDTGIYVNQVAQFMHSGRYYSTILDRPALGEHFTPALLILAPLLYLFPTFLVFPLIKIAALSLCPILLLWLGRKVLGPQSKLIFVVPLLWLIHSQLACITEMEFQPSTLCLPILILVFCFAEVRRWLWMSLALIILLGFKEHLALVWISLGIFLITIKQQTQKGIVIIVAGIISGLFIYSIVMPYFAHGITPTHEGRFGPFVLLPQKLSLLFFGVAGVGFLPCLNWRLLLVAFPAFGIALVSRDLPMLSFNFHYQDLGVCMLMISTVYALKNWNLRVGPRCKHYASAVVFLFLIGFHTRYPMHRLVEDWPTDEQKVMVKELKNLQPVVDQAPSLWALDHLGPYFYSHPDLHTIESASSTLQKTPHNAVIIIANSVNSWPLTVAEISTLRKDLKSSNYFTAVLETDEMAVFRKK